MNRRLLYILPVLAFAVIAVVLFRSLFTTPSILPSALLNQPAPKVELAALDGETLGFGPKELTAGHVSVINVFGSWCAECHIEAPVLMELASMAPANKFEIYGMVQRDTPENSSMKRRALMKHLNRNGCLIVREGGKHTIVKNPITGAESQVPRHREIKPATAHAICKDLGIDPPSGK